MRKPPPDHDLPFTPDEIYRAHRLLGDEKTARDLADGWAELAEKLESGEAIGWGLADGSLALLSLMEDTAERVWEHMSGRTPSQREEFEALREAMRWKIEEEK